MTCRKTPSVGRPRSGAECKASLSGSGVVMPGGDGLANLCGFGKTNSPATFGHGGPGGQIGWGDPATGISIGYCTNGFDRNDIRQARPPRRSHLKPRRRVLGSMTCVSIKDEG